MRNGKGLVSQNTNVIRSNVSGESRNQATGNNECFVAPPPNANVVNGNVLEEIRNVNQATSHNSGSGSTLVVFGYLVALF